MLILRWFLAPPVLPRVYPPRFVPYSDLHWTGVTNLHELLPLIADSILRGLACFVLLLQPLSLSSGFHGAGCRMT